MREIKFRAWDGRKNKMSNFATATLLSTGETNFEMTVEKSCVIMQYTGLKDKNCKEIYEGDIVKRKSSGTRYPDLQPDYYIGNVYFDQTQARYRIETPRHLSIKEPNAYINMQDFRLLSSKNWEIIGNIYENKELLK